MVTISHHSPAFKVRFSEPGTGMRSYDVKCEFPGVILAVEHYYGKGSPGHHDGTYVDCCPLCELTRKRAAKRPKRRRAAKD